MKRIIWYLLILTVILLLPVKPSEVGSLEPIQVVWLSVENENVVMKTDTDDQGKGQNISEALKDMKLHSEGLVYLDTAQFLLVSENAVSRISEIKPLLKGSVRVCLWGGEGELSDAARYMQAHKVGRRLSKWNPQEKLPNLPL